MLPTLMPGDKIYVDKLAFGARLYCNLDSAVFSRNPDVRRMPGFSGIKRNEVIVFNLPVPYKWSKIEFKINLVYCKRVIALPGDTISIVNGFYKNRSTADTIGCIPAQRELAAIPEDLLPSGTRRTYPFDTVHYNWTIKNFGPLYVPTKGCRIRLNRMSYILYRLPIEYETGLPLTLKDTTVYLGNNPAYSYEFKENYYFTAGDNVVNSQDSRYWGLLPEKHIVGIVRYVLYSTSQDDGFLNRKRILKKVE